MPIHSFAGCCKATALLFSAMTICCYSNAQTFIHPGAMHKQSDFDRMKVKVAASAQPWLSGWNAVLANTHSSSTYTLKGPVDTLYRGTGTPENYMKLANDIAAAYANALRWKVAGTTACADKAVAILNAWASLKYVTGTSDKYLASGLYGYEIANVAEIMRTYSGWSPASFTAFKNMMLTVFYPMNHDFLTNHNNACITHYWANWDLCNMASVMAIGILCDDAAKFNEAVTYFKSGAGNGAIEHAVYQLYAGNLGQWQESGRDQGHNTLGIALMGPICEMAWNQGVDLYGYDNNRFLAACEYIAKYNLGDSVPYTTYNNCDNVNQTVISATGRGTKRDCWEMVYNHYANRKGLATPYTSRFADSVRPEGGGGHYDPNSGGYDQLGYGTLTYSIEPTTVSVNPLADAYVRAGTYAATNFGTATSIVTKAGITDGYREGYLRFNLSGITGNITNAKLRLYVKSKEANSTRSAYAISSDTWTETGITYNNKPATGSSLVTDSITAVGWADFDVTGYIVQEYNGDKLASLCIKDPVTNNNIGTDFYSRESGSNIPVLQIITTPIYGARTAAGPSQQPTPGPGTNNPDENSLLKAYPNPYSGNISVQLKSVSAATITLLIYDSKGALVKQMQKAIQAGASQLSLETGGLSRGLYHLSVVWPDGKTKSLNLEKQ